MNSQTGETSEEGAPPGRFNSGHYCRYSVLKKTIVQQVNGQRHMERCRCGRFKLVYCKFFVEGSIYPEIKVLLFDRAGNLISDGEKDET